MHSLTPSRRLVAGIFIMLAYAALEFFAAAMTGLSSLVADAISMLGHSSVMLLALAATWLAARRGDPQRRIEAIGGLLSAIVLLVMGARLGFYGMEHAHDTHLYHAIQGWVGLMLSGFGVLGFLVHAFVAWLLYRGCANVAVLGACLHMSIHVLMMVLMVAGGLLMAFLHWHFMNDVVTYAIAAAMVLSGARLGRQCSLLLLNGTPA